MVRGMKLFPLFGISETKSEILLILISKIELTLSFRDQKNKLPFFLIKK